MRSRAQSTVLVAILAAMLTPSGLSVPPAAASDHADSPLTALRPSADIGDVYFLLDPTDNAFVVLAATLGGLIPPAHNADLGFFDPTVVLTFEIENTGDAKPDRKITVKFGPRTSPSAPQTATVKNPVDNFQAPTTISRSAFGPVGPPTFGGGTSAQQIPTVTTDVASGISFFAGLIDDPFFFDAAAFDAYRNSRLANTINPAILTRGRDSYAGYNTLAVVLRVPVALVKGDGNFIGLAVSAKGPGVKDRAAFPFINSVLIPFERRVAYNASTTAQDAKGKFEDDIAESLVALQTDSFSIGVILGTVAKFGDILRLNVTVPNTGAEGGTNAAAEFPNGRRPNDDVVDTMVTAFNGFVFQGDAVNDNEVPMRDAFPFFGFPHMPFPPGAGSEDLTRN